MLKMSGGYWDYNNDMLAGEIFGNDISINYGLDSDRHAQSFKAVIRKNPLRDAEISALIYDVFCLLHSYDRAISDDIRLTPYLKDVEIFKARWFKRARKDRIKELVDISTDMLKEELYQAFGLKIEDS